MGRQITRADVQAAFDQFAPRAVATFNDDGVTYPQVFYLTLDAEPGSIKQFAAMHPVQVRELMASNRSKNELGRIIRLALRPGSDVRKQIHAKHLFLPDLVIHISEAWFAASPPGKQDEFAKSIDDYKGVADRPDRQEAIAVFIHQHGRTDVGTCPILENPRRAELGKLLTPEDARSEGRFSSEKE